MIERRPSGPRPDGDRPGGARPSHPTRAAVLLMVGVMVFLVVVSALAII
ncbi:MAG: hypothetical protein ACFCVK_20250 [Acidimicrobiales bacterium]